MSYKKGYKFEWSVMQLFRRHGYECYRKAGSKPIDIVVHKKGRTIFLCECKKTMGDVIYLPKHDIEKFYREAGKERAKPLIVYGFARTPIYIAFPSELEETGKMYRIKDGKRKLEDFLKGFKT